MQSYYAPGKILLAGEYGVLLGLNALALPVKKGQWLEFFDFKTPENNPDTLYFKAIDENGETWLQYNFILDQKPWLELNSDELIPLVQLLRMIPEEHWIQGKSFRLETRLEFARTSGLGTSSTFVSLLSQCFLLNPQRVQELLFQGSGYDVAVSNVQKPLIFWRNAGGAHFRPWKLNPDLTQDWSILFLGNKVNSRSSSASICAGKTRHHRPVSPSPSDRRIAWPPCWPACG
jgi:mevalonate kinase